MIGESEKNSPCPVCGGRMRPGLATVPFFLTNAVVLVKEVPAEICISCHEPYMTGKITDRIVSLLRSLRFVAAEILILSYAAVELAPVVPVGPGA